MLLSKALERLVYDAEQLEVDIGKAEDEIAELKKTITGMENEIWELQQKGGV